MASNETPLRVVEVDRSIMAQQDQNPWLPQAANHEAVLRCADVMTTLLNTGGMALTHLLRFIVLLPAMFCMAIAEVLVRFDQVIERNYDKLGVNRG